MVVVILPVMIFSLSFSVASGYVVAGTITEAT
jgi:hypothetical protein